MQNPKNQQSQTKSAPAIAWRRILCFTLITAMMILSLGAFSINSNAMDDEEEYGFDGIETYTLEPGTEITQAVINTIMSFYKDGMRTIYFPAGEYTLNVTTTANGAWNVTYNHLTFLGDVDGNGNPISTIKWTSPNGSSKYMINCSTAATNVTHATFENLIFDGNADFSANQRPKGALNFPCSQTVESDYYITNCVVLNTYNALFTSYGAVTMQQVTLTVDGLTTPSSANSAINAGIGSINSYTNGVDLILTGKGIVNSNGKPYVLVDSNTVNYFSIDNSGVTSGLSDILGKTGSSSYLYYPLPELTLTANPNEFNVSVNDTEITLDFTSLLMKRVSTSSWASRELKIVITDNNSGEVLCEKEISGAKNLTALAGIDFKGEYILLADYQTLPETVKISVVDNDDKGFPDVIAADMTDYVYASTTVALNKLYTVKYDANGADDGGVPVDSNEYLDGEPATVLDNDNLVKEGHIFAGWNTEEDGTGDEYFADDELVITDNVILYAQWDKEIYTVKYYANSGIGTMEDETVEFGDDYIVLANAFAKPYHTFTGWNTNSIGNGTSYSANDVIENVTGNINLYAQWRENPTDPVNPPPPPVKEPEPGTETEDSTETTTEKEQEEETTEDSEDSNSESKTEDTIEEPATEPETPENTTDENNENIENTIKDPAADNNNNSNNNNSAVLPNSIKLYETMPDDALQLDNGWYAAALNDEWWQIFDENGVPLGIIRFTDINDIEHLGQNIILIENIIISGDDTTDLNDSNDADDYVDDKNDENTDDNYYTDTPVNNSKDNPKTGDNLYIILGLLIIAAISLLIIRKKIRR